MEQIDFSQPISEEKLIKITKLLSLNVEIKTRYYALKPYKRCFTGTDAVQFLLDNYCPDVDHAITLGNILIKEGYIVHVHDDQLFENKDLFYRVVDKVTTVKVKKAPHELNINAVERKFKRGIKVETHNYRFKLYKNCFVGAEAIKWVINHNICKDVNDSIQVFNRLIASGMVTHVCGEHFMNNSRMFYRFLDPPKPYKDFTGVETCFRNCDCPREFGENSEENALHNDACNSAHELCSINGVNCAVNTPQGAIELYIDEVVKRVVPNVTFSLQTVLTEGQEHKKNGVIYMTNFRMVFVTFPVESVRTHGHIANMSISWEKISNTSVLFSTHKIYLVIDNGDVLRDCSICIKLGFGDNSIRFIEAVKSTSPYPISASNVSAEEN